MIIGINGYSGSGKDAMGKIIQELQPEKNWQIKKFAGKLKTIASILTGIPEEKFESEEFKKRNFT
jgi:ABC-type dipeptide/oligopeptide/nickel transport system ATPase subunit